MLVITDTATSGISLIMRMQSGDHVTVATDGHVAIVTIDRAPHNHLSAPLLKNLADTLVEIDGNPELRCSVLRTAGKNFCAGADLADAGRPGGIGMADAERLYDQAVRVFAAQKPIVAAIQGVAVGAGLGLALAADVRVAAQNARFSANFVKLGFHPGFGLTHTLPRLVGPSKAALMLLTGRRVPADQALAWGLIDEIVPPEMLDAAALRLAQAIAENAPLALIATRRTLRDDLAILVNAQMRIEHREQSALWPTIDFQEGVRAVGDRRRAAFVGR